MSNLKKIILIFLLASFALPAKALALDCPNGISGQFFDANTKKAIGAVSWNLTEEVRGDKRTFTGSSNNQGEFNYSPVGPPLTGTLTFGWWKQDYIAEKMILNKCTGLEIFIKPKVSDDNDKCGNSCENQKDCAEATDGCTFCGVKEETISRTFYWCMLPTLLPDDEEEEEEKKEEKERPLEIEYPKIGGWRPETVEQAILPQYIKYIFTFAIAIAGLVAFGALIYGGFRYITSAGAPTALTEAKDQIFAGVIGLVILLSSYLILTTINPQLVMLKLEPPTWAELPTDLPGVYLIEKNTGKATAFTSNVPELSKYIPGQKTEKVRIVNPFVWDPETGNKKPGEYFYGAILFPETDYIGKPEFCRKNYDRDSECDVPAGPLNSMIVFREVEKSEGKVILCTETETRGCHEFNEARDYGPLSESGVPDLNKNIWSIKITGNYLLVLHGSVDSPLFSLDIPTEHTTVFYGPREWSDLSKFTLNRCGLVCVWRWCLFQESCATDFAIIPMY